MQLRPMTPDDVPALMRCFERCYGRSYVDRDFYDAARLRARVESGRLRSIVAVAEAGEGAGIEPGEIVGHMGLSFRVGVGVGVGVGAGEQEERTADAGNTVVDPRVRKQKLSGRIAIALIEHARACGLVGFHHYPTTAHPVLQKLSVAGAGVETGLMLDYIPGQTRYREMMESVGGALAVTIVYEPLAEAPSREVFLPARYRGLIEPMVDALRLSRCVVQPMGECTAERTRFTSQDFAARDLHRISLERVGRDLSEVIRSASGSQPRTVRQLDLRLDDPAIGQAVECARAQGYFFSGFFPEYADGDVLRMQRIDRSPATDWNALAERLATPGGHALAKAIRADAGSVAGQSASSAQ